MAWNTTALSNRLGIKYPLIQAPTSGGFTSPGLVAAVANAGGLGSFAACSQLVRRACRRNRRGADGQYSDLTT